MYKCENCDSTFENRFSYSGHRAHCLNKVNYDKLHNSDNYTKNAKFSKEVGEFECEYCGQEFKSNQSLYAHISHCKPNSKRNQYIFTDEDRRKSNEAKDRNIRQGKTIIKGTPHSEETKKILRKKRIKYMQNNPKKTAWFRRNEHKQSFPEIVFRKELEKRNIEGWVYDYKNGIYEYDFAWPDIQLDVEIDGSHHMEEEQKQKDKLRDEWSNNNGWKVVRYKAKKVLSDVDSVIDDIEIKLNEMGW